MKAVVLVLVLCLVAVAVSERRLSNNGPKLRERPMSARRAMRGFPEQFLKAHSRAGAAVCAGDCKSRDGTFGACRQACLPGELFERSVNCNSDPGKFCVCCVAAKILE